ncbi:hypothetical protein [Gemmata sp.]|uniref:hypothetical protein n=1 Tax=Gemmata sp. TaxID=1914242 RepID=UPI003F730AD1
MRLWEIVLVDDTSLDLTAPGVYQAWLLDLHRSGGSTESENSTRSLAGRPLGVAPASPKVISGWGSLWRPEIALMWEQGIRTFRFAVWQSKKEGARPFAIPRDIATDVWNDYLATVRVVAAPGPGHALAYHLTTAPRDLVFAAEASAGGAAFKPQQRELTTRIDIFLARVFRSLMPEFRDDHFCGSCKQPVASETPKGRESRAAVCSHCALQKWKVNKGVEGVRAVWRRSKAKAKDDTKTERGE